MPVLPSSEIVAVAWVRQIPDFTGGVATRLPRSEQWPAAGFVTVSVVGGVAWDTNLHTPVLSVDIWGVNPDSDRPPHGRTCALAEIVRDAVYRDDLYPMRVVPAPGDYYPALVQSAYLVSPEPRRVPDLDQSRSHYVLELALNWTVVR